MGKLSKDCGGVTLVSIKTDKVTANNAFGDTVVVEMIPEIQLNFTMGLIPGTVKQDIRQDGSISESGSVMMLSSGTGSYSYAAAESHDRVTYRAGQGVLARWTAVYDEPSDGVRAFSGLNSKTSTMQFGYSGSIFGINHQANSDAHIFEFRLTTASTTNETAVFTFPNVIGNNTVLVDLTNNGSLIETANEIAAADWSDIHLHGYTVQSSGSIISFVHRDPEAHNEIVNFTSTTMSGTFNGTLASGDNRNDLFTRQSEWSIDKMDGFGPSRMKLNHQFGNVYQCAFQYLGFGNPVYSIENVNTGVIVPVHQTQWCNSHDVTVVSTTSFPIQWVVEHTGSSDTTDTFVKGASAAAFIQGKINTSLTKTYSHTEIVLSVSSTRGHIFSITPKLSFNDRVVLGSAKLIGITITSEDQGANLELYADSTLSLPDWSSVREDRSFMLFDNQSTITSLGRLVTTIGVGKGGSSKTDLRQFNISLHGVPDQDVITVVARSIKATTDISVTLIWEEII